MCIAAHPLPPPPPGSVYYKKMGKFGNHFGWKPSFGSRTIENLQHVIIVICGQLS